MHQAEMHNQSLCHPAGIVTIFLHLFQFITIITFTTKMPCKWMIIEIAHDEAIKISYSDFMSNISQSLTMHLIISTPFSKIC